MNFVFVSPHFPFNYYRFCKALRKNGVKVFGIADMPYESLPNQVKESLDDYYFVHDLKNYDEKYRAVAYFISKHGRIDFLESNNEFWLQDDAKLREDFNIKTGPKLDQIKFFRHKSLMKQKYELANVKTARWHLVESKQGCLDFIKEVGYPVIVKPDDGVGSSFTYKISNDQQLEDFLIKKETEFRDRPYIMEEYIDGELISLDGVCDSNGNIIFPTHHVFPLPIMDIVVEYTDVYYYTSKTIPTDLLNSAQRILHAFGAKSRFFHLEFFRLIKDSKLGKKGDIYGLEVNMRAPGGYTPDMIDFAYSVDIYQIWADIIAFNENREYTQYPHYYCAYVGRRYNGSYIHSMNDIRKKYYLNICYVDDNPPVLADGLGDYFAMAKFDTLQEVDDYFKYSLERKKPAKLAKF